MVKHTVSLSGTNLTVSDHPHDARLDGTRFAPRAEIIDGQGRRSLVCLVPPNHLEPALTQDVMMARESTGAEQIIHLRPDAGVALVARRLGGGFRYQLTDTTVVIGEYEIAISELCERFPVERRRGWNDLPLTGQGLPSFFDLESFMSWWDFVPGKQRFEMLNGQVHLVPRLSRATQDGGFLEAALKRALPAPYHAISNMLFRAGALSAVHVPISICSKPLSEGPFAEPAVALYRVLDTASKRVALDRVAFLRDRSIPCAIFDDSTGVWRSGDWSVMEAVDVGDNSLSLKGVLP